MYCFYNWWLIPPSEHWPCRSFPVQEDLFGCALADGFTIWKLHRQNKHSLSDIHKYTMPWHCIVCCPGYIHGGSSGAGTRAAGIARVLRNPGSEDDMPDQSQEADEYPEFPEPKLVPELPERISTLRRLVQSREKINADIIVKLFGEYPPKKVILHGAPDMELRIPTIRRIVR